MNDDDDENHEFLADMAFTAFAVFVFVLFIALLGAASWVVFT
jgi:hypothetical protein